MEQTLIEKCSRLVQQIDLVFEQIDSDGWSEIKMEQGSARTKNVLTVPGLVTVMYMICSHDAVFEAHQHDQTECFIICSDHQMIVQINDQEFQAIKATPFCVRPHIQHRVLCQSIDQTECHLIAITVPDNFNWPDNEPHDVM